MHIPPPAGRDRLAPRTWALIVVTAAVLVAVAGVLASTGFEARAVTGGLEPNEIYPCGRAIFAISFRSDQQGGEPSPDDPVYDASCHAQATALLIPALVCLLGGIILIGTAAVVSVHRLRRAQELRESYWLAVREGHGDGGQT